MKLLFLFTVIVFSNTCQTGGKRSKEISLFIMPEYKDDFFLRVNDGKKFRSYIINNEVHGPQEFIGKIKSSSDTVKIYLRIFNKDTTFLYNVSKVDSLFFGLTIENMFFVVQNENEYISYYD